MNVFIDLSAMCNVNCQNLKLMILDFTNHAVIFYSIAPKFLQIARKRFSEASRIFRCLKFFIEVGKNKFICSLVEFFKVLKSQRRKFKLPFSACLLRQDLIPSEPLQTKVAYQFLFRYVQIETRQLNNH